MRVAVLDDDSTQRDFVGDALSPAGYCCTFFAEGRALISNLRHETYAIVILDWNLTDIPGDQVLRWIRDYHGSSLPVLFMTSRSSERDIVHALNAGADDYVTKPVHANVLLARVSNLLRRTSVPKQAPPAQQFGDFIFNLREEDVYFQGKPQRLSKKEFQVALLLFQNLGRPLSRSHIVDTVWKHSTPGMTTRTIDTHISWVRKKLDLRPESGYIIVPIYGYGYRLERLG